MPEENTGLQSHEIRLVIEDKTETHYSLCCKTKDSSIKPVKISKPDVERIASRSSLLDAMVTDPVSGRFATDLGQTGMDLFSLFLAPFKDFHAFVKARTGENSPVLINIQNDIAIIHALLWELLFSPEVDDAYPFLVANPRFRLVKTTTETSAGHLTLSPGPLRILLMSLSPENAEPVLNYEKEEQIILDAVASLKQKRELEIDVAVLGTLEELKQRLSEKPYHVVHLSGHGDYVEEEQTGYILFEDTSGLQDRVSAKKLAETLLGFQSVRLVFLSACNSCRGVMGVAHELLKNGIPMVIGMMNKIQNSAATRLAEHFYTGLALKQPPEQALQAARQKYLDSAKNFQWAIPGLFCTHTKTTLVDWNRAPEPSTDRVRPVVLYGKIAYRPSGFVGRRKAIRDFVKLFRDRKPPAFCITGAGGIGRSTLSTRLSDILEKTSYMVVPIRGELTQDAFIRATKSTLVSHGELEHKNYLESLTGSQDKITYILSNVMGQHRVLYLLDNFEDNLKQSAGFKGFKNPFWEQTFRMILEELPHTQSCILITCRYTIPGIPETMLLHKTLPEMTESEVRKLVLFNEGFQEIEYKHVSDIYKTIGGNPKAIEELGVLLAQADITWKVLEEKLSKVSKEMRQFTVFDTLFSLLPEPVQEFFFKASVYTAPVPLEALHIQEPDEEKTGKYLDTLLQYSLIQKIEDIIHNSLYYQVHPLNRGYAESLWKDESSKETAHKQAALYYREKMETEGKTSPAELITCAEHLDQAMEYSEMVGLILGYARELDLKGFWDESEYLHNFIIKNSSAIDKKDLGTTYNNIGLIYSNKGEWDKALEYYFKSEKIGIEVGDRAGLVFTWFNIGTAYAQKKDNTSGEPYIILAGYAAIVLGMKYELNQMAWALSPVVEKLGREEFLKQGAELARKRGL